VASTATRLSSRLRTPFKPRRDHPGVVEHQDVARPKQPGQVVNRQVLKRRLGGNQEQARGVARI
jgi:hypothetical protein